MILESGDTNLDWTKKKYITHTPVYLETRAAMRKKSLCFSASSIRDEVGEIGGSTCLARIAV
jgi:hypothetical protein